MCTDKVLGERYETITIHRATSVMTKTTDMKKCRGSSDSEMTAPTIAQTMKVNGTVHLASGATVKKSTYYVPGLTAPIGRTTTMAYPRMTLLDLFTKSEQGECRTGPYRR
jgi:hypothetical protein